MLSCSQGHLQLLTSPVASTSDVVELFQAGLAPVSLAMPIVLNAIGATQDDIEAAMETVILKANTKTPDSGVGVGDKPHKKPEMSNGPSNLQCATRPQPVPIADDRM